mgnify:CR=1 FL=1
MKKFKSLFNEVNEQPEHEITVGNYTTKFFYMCGSAQKVMSANADKEGAEELTKMQRSHTRQRLFSERMLLPTPLE